jgi:hypothetical protein
MEKYAIVFGSDMYIGTNGILTVQIDGKLVEFFRIREIFRERSSGSYLTVDCDIKDKDNVREVKLAKSRPVVQSDIITVHYDHKETHVKRDDGSTVIRIDQIEKDDPTLPQTGPVHDALFKESFDAIIRITGEFYAGQHKLIVDNETLKVGGITIWGNLKIGTGGLHLTDMGFSM